mmetsp:Transcript_8529/g.20624  ORF Transcript_8529/g.20624 Transcript_8529/m.20624 type:complete len:609 (-) Transcript_8529:190-2016(-)
MPDALDRELNSFTRQDYTPGAAPRGATSNSILQAQRRPGAAALPALVWEPGLPPQPRAARNHEPPPSLSTRPTRGRRPQATLGTDWNGVGLESALRSAAVPNRLQAMSRRLDSLQQEHSDNSLLYPPPTTTTQSSERAATTTPAPPVRPSFLGLRQRPRDLDYARVEGRDGNRNLHGAAGAEAAPHSERRGRPTALPILMDPDGPHAAQNTRLSQAGAGRRTRATVEQDFGGASFDDLLVDRRGQARTTYADTSAAGTSSTSIRVVEDLLDGANLQNQERAGERETQSGPTSYAINNSSTSTSASAGRRRGDGHMLTGANGGLGSTNPEDHDYNPYLDQSAGADFLAVSLSRRNGHAVDRSMIQNGLYYDDNPYHNLVPVVRREDREEHSLADVAPGASSEDALPLARARALSQGGHHGGPRRGTRHRPTVDDFGGGLDDILVRRPDRLQQARDEFIEQTREAAAQRGSHLEVGSSSTTGSGGTADPQISEEFGGSLGDILPRRAPKKPARNKSASAANRHRKEKIRSLLLQKTNPCVGEDCAFCLAEFEVRQQVQVLPCNHVFHTGCWKKHCVHSASKISARTETGTMCAEIRCPLCRTDVSHLVST